MSYWRKIFGKKHRGGQASAPDARQQTTATPASSSPPAKGSPAKACLACRRKLNALLAICPTCGNDETTIVDGPEWLLIVQAHVTTVQSNDRAVRLFRAGQLDDAIAELLRGLEVNSQYATGHSNLGFLYLRKGQLDHAVECLLRALEVDPQHRDALDHLLDVLHALIDEVVQIGYREGFYRRVRAGPSTKTTATFARAIGTLIAKIGEKGAVKVDGRSLDSVQLVRVVVHEVQRRMGYHSKSTCLMLAWEGLGGWSPSPASSTAASWCSSPRRPLPCIGRNREISYNRETETERTRPRPLEEEDYDGHSTDN